ncbi:unnamed protein product [Pedinophyceae sp. YPF-701]|nr:unnamed protein product [Pedinophyceae sp. YPF-701]
MDTPDRKLMCAARVAKRCDAQLSSDAPPDVDGSWRFKLWAEPDAEALAIAKKRLPEQDPGAPKYVHKPSLSELVGTAQLNLKARYEDLPAQASKQAFAALDAHFSEEDASRRAKKKLEFVLNPYGTLNAGSEAAAVDIGTMYGCTPQEIIERAADETQVYKMLQEFAAKAGQSLTTVCKKLVAPGSPLMTAIGLKVRLLKAVVREGSALAPRGGGSPEGLPREGGAGTPEAGQALVAQPRQGAARLAMKETLEALRCAATEIDSARAVRAHVFHAKVAALTTEIQALNAAMDRFHHAKLTAVKLSTVEDLDHTQLSSFERMERMAIGSIRDARMRADDVRESLLALEKKFHEQDVADERKGKEIAARMADLRKALFGV